MDDNLSIEERRRRSALLEEKWEEKTRERKEKEEEERNFERGTGESLSNPYFRYGVGAKASYEPKPEYQPSLAIVFSLDKHFLNELRKRVLELKHRGEVRCAVSLKQMVYFLGEIEKPGREVLLIVDSIILVEDRKLIERAIENREASLNQLIINDFGGYGNTEEARRESKVQSYLNLLSWDWRGREWEDFLRRCVWLG